MPLEDGLYLLLDYHSIWIVQRSVAYLPKICGFDSMPTGHQHT